MHMYNIKRQLLKLLLQSLRNNHFQVPCRMPNSVRWSINREASLVSISLHSQTCTSSGDLCPVSYILGWASCTFALLRWPSLYWRSPNTSSGRSAFWLPWRPKTNIWWRRPSAYLLLVRGASKYFLLLYYIIIYR